MGPNLTPRTQTISDALVYWLSFLIYAAFLHYLFDAPDWAVFGFAFVLAKVDRAATAATRRPNG